MIPFDSLVEALLSEIKEALATVDHREVTALRHRILSAGRIFTAGKGRSGLQMRAFAMRLMHLGLPVFDIGDVTTPAIRQGDLLLIGSGSGSTTSLVQYAARAGELHAHIALITIAESSPIGERADLVLHINAPTPKIQTAGSARSIQPMGSLFEQALGLLLDVIVLQLMEELGTDTAAMFTRHANLE